MKTGDKKSLRSFLKNNRNFYLFSFQLKIISDTSIAQMENSFNDALNTLTDFYVIVADNMDTVS